MQPHVRGSNRRVLLAGGEVGGVENGDDGLVPKRVTVYSARAGCQSARGAGPGENPIKRNHCRTPTMADAVIVYTYYLTVRVYHRIENGYRERNPFCSIESEEPQHEPARAVKQL